MEEFLIDDGGVSTLLDAADWHEICGHCASLFGSDCDSDEAAGEDSGDDGFWELGEVFVGSASTEDTSRQGDETEALAAMFPDSFVPQVTANEWLFRSPLSKTIYGVMRVKLPADYPSRSPPVVMLDIPGVHDLKGIVCAMRKEFQPDSEVGWAWGERFEELCRIVRERREKAAVAKFPAQAEARGDVPQRWPAWSHSCMLLDSRRPHCCSLDPLDCVRCSYCRWSDGRGHVRCSNGIKACRPPSRWEMQELNRQRKGFLEKKKRDEAKANGAPASVGARQLPPHPQTGTGRVR